MELQYYYKTIIRDFIEELSDSFCDAFIVQFNLFKLRVGPINHPSAIRRNSTSNTL